MTQPQTAEDRQAEVDKEWGQYVATGPIDIGSARAFNEGEPVPASHVTRGVVRPDQVAKTSTKAGQAVVENTRG